MLQIVKIDEKGRALTHVVHVKGRKNDPDREDEVMFIDLGNAGPWWITFDKPAGAFKPGSPFGAAEFEVPKGGTKKTGLPLTTADFGTYKYNVRRDGPVGLITNDPDVDIDP